MTSIDIDLQFELPDDGFEQESSQGQGASKNQNTIGYVPVPSEGDQIKTDSQNNLESHSNYANQEERQFILLLLNRDQHAWQDFVERYNKLIVSRVLATCREFGVVSQPDLVEECGAEVMATLFQGDMNGLRQFQGRSKLSTWLAVIARRTTLNFLHRQKRERENTRPNDSQFDMAAISEDSRKRTSDIDKEDRAKLQNCMNRLKPTDRKALMLHFDQQLSYAEIGHALGISENGVGPKLHRAQKRLKKLMESKNQPT